MRSFVNLSKPETLRLNNQFPEILDLVRLEQVDAYNHYSVSVFDHWLSPEEAKIEIDQISFKKIESHNEKLFKLVTGLAGQTDTYLIKFLGRKKSQITFRKFLSQKGLDRSVKPKNHLISDSFRFILLLPELETAYFEGSDFTHHFYTKNNNGKEVFQKMAKSNNLYILE